jgi:hypothetical protein
MTFYRDKNIRRKSENMKNVFFIFDDGSSHECFGWEMEMELKINYSQLITNLKIRLSA